MIEDFTSLFKIIGKIFGQTLFTVWAKDPILEIDFGITRNASIELLSIQQLDISKVQIFSKRPNSHRIGLIGPWNEWIRDKHRGPYIIIWANFYKVGYWSIHDLS